jgi:lysophospholipase L1-like esterase
LVLLTTVSVGSWLTAETVLTLYLRRTPSAPFHLKPPDSQWVFRPRPDIQPGLSAEGRFTTNSMGLRGPELPPREAAYRILCLGGSTTECLYLDDTKTWTHLLLERLNQDSSRRPVWVGGAGRAGYQTIEHLLFLEQSPLASQVDCVVVLAGINDLLGVLQNPPGFDRWLHVEAEAREKQLRPLWGRSPLLTHVRKTYHNWTAAGRTGPALVDDLEGLVNSERRRQRREGGICDELPDLEPGLRQFSYRLRRIVSLCRANAVRPVFLTQPVLWDKDLSARARSLLWLGWRQPKDGLPNRDFLTVEKLRNGMDQYNETLRRLCKELRVECVDLTPMNGQEAFFWDDAHYTDAGAQEIARRVADWFLQHPREASLP